MCEGIGILARSFSSLLYWKKQREREGWGFFSLSLRGLAFESSGGASSFDARRCSLWLSRKRGKEALESEGLESFSLFRPGRD